MPKSFFASKRISSSNGDLCEVVKIMSSNDIYYKTKELCKLKHNTVNNSMSQACVPCSAK